jgi:hypothetical protein
MTKDEFRSELDKARDTITAFLSALPADVTVGEALRAVRAEQPTDAQVDAVYCRYMSLN